MSPLSCLSGSPCKTETDEAAGTCSPVSWGILIRLHTNTHCLYPLSHVGLISAEPVRAGCLSNRRRGRRTVWLNTQAKKMIHVQTRKHRNTLLIYWILFVVRHISTQRRTIRRYKEAPFAIKRINNRRSKFYFLCK